MARCSELKALAVRDEERAAAPQVDDFGALLDQEWQHKKRMSTRISSPELDELYDVARARRARIGGKITGAGGGGYMLLYCRYDRKHSVAEVLRGSAARSTGGARAAGTADVAGQRQAWRLTGVRDAPSSSIATA